MKRYVFGFLFLLAWMDLAIAEGVELEFREHCKVFGPRAVCYLEETSGDGLSSFHISESSLKVLGLNLEKLAEAGVEVKVLADEEYKDLASLTQAERVDYQAELLRKRSWRCSIGSAGSMLGGGLGGAAFGPLGILAGAAGGLMVGTASFC